MELNDKQIAAIKKLVQAKKELEKSGLQFILVDEQLHLYSREDEVCFNNVNELDSFHVSGFGFMNSYGL